jgi:hypothetical protein
MTLVDFMLGMYYCFFSWFIKQDSISRQVYTIYIFFAKNSDEEISQKAIVGLGKCVFCDFRGDTVCDKLWTEKGLFWVFYFINSLLNIYFCSGFLCIRYPKFLLEEGARDLYQRVLSPAHASVRLKLQVITVFIKSILSA